MNYILRRIRAIPQGDWLTISVTSFFFALPVLMFIGWLVGYIKNIQKLLELTSVLSTEVVVRAIGAVLLPLGGVMGWF